MAHPQSLRRPGMAQDQAPATPARHERATRWNMRSWSAGRWRALLGWIAEDTLVPARVPARWRGPTTAFLLAVLLQLVATFLSWLLVTHFPTYSFPDALTLLAIALTALSLGAAPSLAATLFGVLLLEVVVLPGTLHGGVHHPGDVLEIGIALVVGGIITAVASRVEHARRQARRAALAAEARELVLRTTNERMDEFLSIASHELRSPLTGIKGALQLSRRRLDRMTARPATSSADLVASLERMSAGLELAERQVDRQTALIGDLLDVSRIRANRLDLHLTTCDLADVVREAVEEQRLGWPERTITLTLREQQVPVEADPVRIGQVVTNYLTNALKYSPADRPVHAELCLTSTEAKVLVRDQGPGLTGEQRSHIWERFHRVPGIQQQSGSGTGLGLGLYICRMIVERHGGAVGVDSIPSQGSTFWFSLSRHDPAS